jgi:hypothetical protein
MKKPTLKELREYANTIGYSGFDPELFIAHYEANGWMVGRVKMKSWRATVVTWKKREPDFARRKPQLPYRTRENRINEFNRRKARLMRMEQTPAVKRELAYIQAQLHKL